MALEVKYIPFGGISYMAKGIAIKEVEKSNVDEEKEDISRIYISN